MLDALRKGAATWVAKIFIAILVLSFAVWGIADIFTGRTNDSIGKVGDVEISAMDYQRAYQNEIQLLQQQLRRPITPELARNLGLDSRVLTRLVAGAALDSHARELGVDISEEALLQLIRTDPAFKDGSGNFSRIRFDQSIRSIGLSEQGYLLERKETAVRGQLTSLFSNAPSKSKIMLDASDKYWNARREVEYFTIGQKQISKIETPTEELLRTYFNDNKSKYLAPQYRELDVLFLDPETVKQTIVISETDVRKLYDDNLDKYKVAEKRKIEQIPFPDEAAAKEALKKIKKGKSFLEVAKDLGISETDLSLGTVEKAELFDQTIGEAAFTLKKDEISKPVKGNLSTVLLRVTEIVPGLTRSFEEMKEEIKTDTQTEKATDKVLELYDVIEEERVEGGTFQEIAAKHKLDFLSFSVSQAGKTPGGNDIDNLTNRRALLDAAFDSDVGIENDAAELVGGAYAWFDVTKVIPARQKTFEEAKKEIEKDWRETQIQEKLAKLAKELVDRGNNKEGINALAKSVGAKLEKPISFRRTANLRTFPKAASTMAFTLKEQEVASAATEDGLGRVIFKLSKLLGAQDTPADQTKQLEQRISNGLIDDLLAQYLTGLQKGYGMSVNEQALGRLTGSGGNY